MEQSDAPFEPDDPEAPWNNPDISLIRLLNGKTVTAHVNGLDLETNTGFVFVDGQERAVRVINSNQNH